MDLAQIYHVCAPLRLAGSQPLGLSAFQPFSRLVWLAWPLGILLSDINSASLSITGLPSTNGNCCKSAKAKIIANELSLLFALPAKRARGEKELARAGQLPADIRARALDSK